MWCCDRAAAFGGAHDNAGESDALLVGKEARGHAASSYGVQAAILAELRKRSGATVVGDGQRGKWRLMTLIEAVSVPSVFDLKDCDHQYGRHQDGSGYYR